MESGKRRLRMKAQDVVVRRVVGDGYQVPAERLCVLEGEIYAPRQLRHRLGHVALQSVLRGQICHPSQSQRWDQITRAVQCLNAATAGRVRVGIRVVAHAPTLRVWLTLIGAAS